jgi:serine/threonine protein kinase
MDLIGQTLGGRYKVEEKLGEGGMATVYKAADTKLPRAVALKIIRTDRPMDPSAMERFKHEAETLARLGHTNIVPILDYGEHENMPYLVMPYLPGGTLQDRMQGPIPPGEAARLLIPIAQALSHAHHKHVIHRDVKPSNILFNEDGAPMLSDFGIVKILDQEAGAELTTTGMTLGTPAYMAPEQVLGRTPDARADVYALGVVFYEMVTGHKPYEEDTPMALAAKQALEPPPHPRQFNPSLTDSVDNLLMTALANQPEHRFSSMDAFANALRNAAGDEFTPTPAAPIPTRPRREPEQPQAYFSSPPPPSPQGGYGWNPPPYTPPKKGHTGLWVGLGLLGVALLSGLIVLAITLTAGPQTGSTSNSVQQAGTQSRDVYFSPSAQPITPMPTAEPLPTLQPQATEVAYHVDSYGSSVLGRALRYACIGTGNNTLFLVGGIHGDEPNPVNLMYELESAFRSGAALSDQWKVCIVYDMNPDGAASNDHFDANGVDLNRNWATSDWTQEYTRSDGTLYKGGGISPFSEPETSNLRNLMQQFHNEGALVAVFFHSTQTGNSDVRPAYAASWDWASENAAKAYNGVAGYTYNRTSTTFYTGESLHWCGENGYVCFGVEMPNNGAYNSADVMKQVNGLIAAMNATY